MNALGKLEFSKNKAAAKSLLVHLSQRRRIIKLVSSSFARAHGLRAPLSLQAMDEKHHV